MDPLAPVEALVRIDVAAVASLVTHLRAQSEQLGAVAAWLRAAPGQLLGWAGAGSDAFTRVAASAGHRGSSLGEALGTAAAALSALATALQSVEDEARAARRMLQVAGPAAPDAAVASQLAACTARFSAADLRAAAVLADVLLLDLAHRLPAPSGASLDPANAAALLAVDVSRPPAVPDSPPAVTLWWAGLSPAARTAATADWSAWPGGADGIPAGVRDAVNRRRLANALHDARVAFAATPLAVPFAYLAASARLEKLQALAEAIRPAGSQLLLFDPTGDGRAVIATADVQTCREVAVLVPGMSNELDDVPSLTAEARRLAAAAGSGTAVVAWLGYDSPKVRQVFSDGRARVGARLLQRFVAGLRSTAARLQHVTVFGHSYGSLVAGLAARRGLAADDLVLLASPGVEADRASQLHLPAGHVWAAEALTDPIRLVFLPTRLGRLFGIDVPPVFGPDPADAAFGARHFPDGGAYGHSGYFASGSQSLASLAAIVGERPLP